MHFTAPSKFVILLVTRIKVQIEDVAGAISALVIWQRKFPRRDYHTKRRACLWPFLKLLLLVSRFSSCWSSWAYGWVKSGESSETCTCQGKLVWLIVPDAGSQSNSSTWTRCQSLQTSESRGAWPVCCNTHGLNKRRLRWGITCVRALVCVCVRERAR